MNDDATLAAVRNHLTQVRGSLGGVHMNTPANEIVARARWRRTRHGLAMGATLAVLGLALALGLGLPSGSQVRPVHVHLTAWSVDTNSNGTVTVDVHELTHAALLAKALGEAGVPAVVTTALCLDPQNQGALAKATGALRSGRTGVVIDPAAIPSGTELLFSILRVRVLSPDGEGQNGTGFGWGLVNSGAPLDCHASKPAKYYHTATTH